MKPWTHIHRLRKYRRKQAAAARRGEDYARVSLLKWRYWFKVYGGHECLWVSP